MGKILSSVDGYKVYITVAIGILLQVAVNVFHVVIPGIDPNPEWLNVVLGWVGIGGFRSAVDKLRKETPLPEGPAPQATAYKPADTALPAQPPPSP